MASEPQEPEVNPLVTCKLWVVIDRDDMEAPPMAAFPSESEARGWVALTRADEGCIDIEVCEADITVKLPDEEGTVLPGKSP